MDHADDSDSECAPRCRRRKVRSKQAVCVRDQGGPLRGALAHLASAEPPRPAGLIMSMPPRSAAPLDRHERRGDPEPLRPPTPGTALAPSRLPLAEDAEQPEDLYAPAIGERPKQLDHVLHGQSPSWPYDSTLREVWNGPGGRWLPQPGFPRGTILPHLRPTKHLGWRSCGRNRASRWARISHRKRESFHPHDLAGILNSACTL